MKANDAGLDSNPKNMFTDLKRVTARTRSCWRKGRRLCEMTRIGLNVPPGFTVTTGACLAYLETNHLPHGLMDDIKVHMAALEKKTGKGFGGANNPLLVSVRSGSAMSMPGMMDTILNLGSTRFRCRV